MDPQTISGLINLGAAGAVIIVVIIFLKSNEKRDAEWRGFFTSLNDGNKTDIKELADTLKSLVEGVSCLKTDLLNHDRSVVERVEEIKRVARTPRAKAN